MPPELAAYIAKYAYLAVFSLVFIQELGVPNPVPNELVMLFSGYLVSTGVLKFPLVFLAAVSADFIGTTVLYFVFYLFGSRIIAKKPSWLPISVQKNPETVRKNIAPGHVGNMRRTPYSLRQRLCLGRGRPSGNKTADIPFGRDYFRRHLERGICHPGHYSRPLLGKSDCIRGDRQNFHLISARFSNNLLFNQIFCSPPEPKIFG